MYICISTTRAHSVKICKDICVLEHTNTFTFYAEFIEKCPSKSVYYIDMCLCMCKYSQASYKNIYATKGVGKILQVFITQNVL